jgi:hypothetical protein
VKWFTANPVLMGCLTPIALFFLSGLAISRWQGGGSVLAISCCFSSYPHCGRSLSGQCGLAG